MAFDAALACAFVAMSSDFHKVTVGTAARRGSAWGESSGLIVAPLHLTCQVLPSWKKRTKSKQTNRNRSSFKKWLCGGRQPCWKPNANSCWMINLITVNDPEARNTLQHQQLRLSVSGHAPHSHTQGEKTRTSLWAHPLRWELTEAFDDQHQPTSVGINHKKNNNNNNKEITDLNSCFPFHMTLSHFFSFRTSGAR